MSASAAAAPREWSDTAQARRARGFSWAHRHQLAAGCFLLLAAAASVYVVAVVVVVAVGDHTLPETGDWRG